MNVNAETKIETITRHYEPGTWDHPLAREMGLRPDVSLTVEIECSQDEIWQRIRANGLVVYYGPIARPLIAYEDEDDELGG